MSDTTKIEWATRTFNPWEGCTKVSPGCANCYAEARNHRFGMDNWGKGKPRRRTSAATWKNPVKWNRKAMGGTCQTCGQRLAGATWEAIGRELGYSRCPGTTTACGGTILYERARIFPSLCDWLDDEVPIEWLADFCRLMMQTPNLDWLLLSKRPENWSDRLHAAMRTIHDAADDWISGWLDGVPPANVWIGTSVEDQKRADERIPELLKIPAKVRFLSVEPLLGPVALNATSEFSTVDMMDGGIDWVIIGGESGPGARPCNIEWIRDIVRQCQSAGVPCFVKQLGSIAVADTGIPEAKTHWMRLKHPKGGDMAEWPEDLRVRQFPLSQEATHRATDGPH